MAARTTSLLALAFDPEVPTADDPMGERLLDAALGLAGASGLRHLTMDDIAARAGVGRMTLYRRFQTKAALIEALAVRECRRCLEAIADALDPGLPIDERVAAGFVAMLRVVDEHPLLARLARVEPEALLSELRRDGSAVFRLVREFLVSVVSQAQRAGELRSGDPAVMAELALRLSASFVLFPDSVIAPDDNAAVREVVRTLIGPVAV